MKSKKLSNNFFLEFDLFVSVLLLFKLSIRSSIDLAFLVHDSLILIFDVVGVKLDERDVRTTEKEKRNE